MLSRVAETIYWIGRYLERAENTARLVNVNTNLVLDLPKGIIPDWYPLIRILGFENTYAERHPEITERRIVNFLISDETNPGSIISTIAAARENSRTVREILPREAWETLNTFYQTATENKQDCQARSSRHSYLLNIISTSQQISGLLAGTMNHNAAYRFLNLGRKLERADMTTRIINVRSENPLTEIHEAAELKPFEDILWMSMLKSLDGYQMYRQSMQVRIRRSEVLKFLFCRIEFPRSFIYCIKSIGYNLSLLPKNQGSIEIMRDIRKMINDAPMAEMDNEKLHKFIDQLQISLGHLHHSIAEAYFPTIDEQVA